MLGKIVRFVAMESEKNIKLRKNDDKKSLIKITIRCKNNETIGNINLIKKLLENKDLEPFYLVKVTDNDKIIYLEEVASKQMPISLIGDNLKLIVISQYLSKDIVNVFEMLNANVFAGYFYNQCATATPTPEK
jgi:hypothetical protein